MNYFSTCNDNTRSMGCGTAIYLPPSNVTSIGNNIDQKEYYEDEIAEEPDKPVLILKESALDKMDEKKKGKKRIRKKKKYLPGVRLLMQLQKNKQSILK